MTVSRKFLTAVVEDLNFLRLSTHDRRRIPYSIAMKRKNRACAALLNPSSAEPLVWPSKLKFINELNQEAKVLLEMALAEANMEREKAILKENSFSLPSPLQSDVELDDAESEVISIPSLKFSAVVLRIHIIRDPFRVSIYSYLRQF